MHPYKELQKVAREYATQLNVTIELLSRIQDNRDFELDEELISKFEESKALTDGLSRRFKELMDIERTNR